MVRFIVTKNYEEMSKEAAKVIASDIRNKPAFVLGTATGSTPVGTYQELIQLNQQNIIDFSQVTTFGLDEYAGLPSDHLQSYARFMEDNLFSKININRDLVHMPNGIFDDLNQELHDYEERIKVAGGIDLQILGVGRNGHIGFNEPAHEMHAHTHLITLTEQTIKDNARFFESIEDVPRQAITMGMGTILKSRKLLFIASGSEKADAVRKTFSGKISTDCPASFIQLHPNVVAILDEAAAQELKKDS